MKQIRRPAKPFSFFGENARKQLRPILESDSTTRFGHVGTHQHSLPRVLPGASCRNAEVRADLLSETPKATPRMESQMSEMKHYRYQADQAKRLANQVSDPDVRARLLEMAEEYSRYATLIEVRTSERHIAG
jgi:hypothetical protein